jgi:hypothetical protein
MELIFAGFAAFGMLTFTIKRRERNHLVILNFELGFDPFFSSFILKALNVFPLPTYFLLLA